MPRRRTPPAAATGLALLALLLLGADPARAEETAPDAPPGAKKAPPEEPAQPSPPREVPPTLQLDEVVVSAEVAGEGGSVRTLEREALEQSGAQSVVEALERDPAVLGSSGRRGERTFVLRGFEQRQVTVLWDGAPAYVPYDGLLDLGLLPLAAVERLTLVKGPGSVLYGPNGMGGAVNIVTRAPGRGPLAGLLAEHGSGDGLNLAAEHALRLGPLAYTLHGGWQRRTAFPLSGDFSPDPREGGGWRDNSDRSLYHLGGKARLELGHGHRLTLSGLLIDGARGVPPGLLEPVVRYWRFSRWRAAGLTLGHSGAYLGGRLELSELAYLRLFDNLVDAYDDAGYATQQTARAFHSWYHDQLAGARLRGRLSLDGAPWGDTELRLWLSGQLDRHDEDPRTAGDAAITRGLLTLAPEAELFFGQRWSVLAGLQLDLELPGSTPAGDAASRLGWGPLLSARFDPWEGLSLRAAVARRGRFPTLKERYTAAGGRREPNPDLAPESAWHFGLEGSWRGPRGLSVQAALYDAEVTDLIELVPLAGGKEQLQNIPGSRLLGLDLSLAARPWPWLELSAAYAWLHARRHQPRSGSDRLAYRPEHRAELSVGLYPLRYLRLRTALQVVGPRPYPHPASGVWEELPAHALLHLHAEVDLLPGLTLHARAQNLLDADTASQAGYPDPGRELWVGLRARYGSSPSPRP